MEHLDWVPFEKWLKEESHEKQEGWRGARLYSECPDPVRSDQSVAPSRAGLGPYAVGGRVVQKSITINAPVDEIYSRLANPENLSAFSST